MPKRYDRIFKTFAEKDPRGLLQLFGSLPLDAEAEVQIVDRELGLPMLIADHVYGGRFAAEFMVLGGLRYDKDELAALLGRLGNMLTYEQLKASSVIQHFLEEGQTRGREEEARRSLRIVLASRFPGLEQMPELDRVSGLHALENLLAKITIAETPEAARAAIQAAVAAS